MKKMEEISTIIAKMDDVLFNRLNNADDDVWSLDDRVAKNGRRRLRYNLKKVGLTEDEWYAWCDL